MGTVGLLPMLCFSPGKRVLSCRAGVNGLLIDWFACSTDDLELQTQIAAVLQVLTIPARCLF